MFLTPPNFSRRAGTCLDADFLDLVDAALREQRGLAVVVLLDLFRRGLGGGFAHFFQVGARDDFALGGLDLLHHLGVAVDLLVVGLLQRQLLVDQALEDLLAGGVGLLGPQVALLLQHKVDLVDRHLGLVHLGGGLAGGLVLLVATAGQQHSGGGQGQRAQAQEVARRAGCGHVLHSDCISCPGPAKLGEKRHGHITCGPSYKARQSVMVLRDRPTAARIQARGRPPQVNGDKACSRHGLSI
jgi:hypothetical protein